MKNTSFSDFFEDTENSSLEYDISSEASTILFLKKCCGAYYTEGETPLLTDQEYDRLYETAKLQWPDNPFFSDDVVGFIPSGSKVEHEFVLGSLTKFKNETISDFLSPLDPEGSLFILPKYDGLSIYAEYNNGKLVRAATRGNGTVGTDITKKASIFAPTIWDKQNLKLRGEILLHGDSYKDLGFANRRNGASGIIGLKDIDKEKLKMLTVIWYEVLSPEMDLEKSLTLLKNVFNKIKVKHFSDPDRIFNNMLDKFNGSIDLDGLVIAYDSKSEPYRRENVYKPSNKVCWKPETEAAVAEIKEISWTTSRTGKVVPVAVFKEPVFLAGTSVSRATCYNAKFVLDNKLKEGTKITVTKSNYIIPKILNVVD